MTDFDDKDELVFNRKKKQVFSKKKDALPDEADISEKRPARAAGSWKVLVVDDEQDVHAVTQLALSALVFQDKPVELINAYKATEAQTILETHPDIAVILLDVVMETTHAGLELVKFIREKQGNPFVRIILRTGQPGEAPEREVIEAYQIDDYKTKVELTADRLFASVLASLRTYEAMLTIESYRQHLEEKVRERTQQLQERTIQLEKMNEEKNQFLGIVSHDLKNPLSGVRGLSQTALEYGSKMPKSDMMNFFQMIKNGCDRMFVLVENLLDINRLESGRIDFKSQFVDLRNPLYEVVERYKDPAAKKDITLTLNEAGTVCLSYVDESAITQIFDNLISNAVKYTYPGKSIDVTISVVKTADDNGLIRVMVKDEGQGLTQDDKQKIFGKFAKLSAKPTGEEHSTGLGLSIVKKLIEAMNGTIRAESEGKDQGTTFIADFPRADRK